MSHPNDPGAGWFGGQSVDSWQTRIAAVANRFDREYRGELFELPEAVEALAVFHDKASGKLQAKVASEFWQLARVLKNQRCLDIGCGLSFLIYPCWREWNAYFYGQEVSPVARDFLNSRGPQLNSKLFRGVKLGPAHRLAYEPAQFDWVIATGWSCYFPLDYWHEVMGEVKRVLKPGGQLVFDVLDPEVPVAENWAILETYMGAEVFLEPLTNWEKIIQAEGGKVLKRLPGELFQLYQMQF